MKTKTAVFTAIALGLLAISASAQPAAVHFVSGTSQGFWITNKTDKTLVVTLTTIEVKSGVEWKTNSTPSQSGPGVLYFLRAGSNLGWLAPHQAGLGRLQGRQSFPPESEVWRGRITVEEKVTSDDGTTHLGPPQEIYSDEVRPK